MKKQETDLKAKEDALASTHVNLVKFKDKRENLINAYMTSPEFQELITKHDERLYPTLFSVGWNAGIQAVRERLPKVDPMDFEHPSDPIIINQLMESAEDKNIEEGEREGETEGGEDQEEEDRILDPAMTPLKAPGTQGSSNSSFSSSDNEEEGHMDFEP